MKILAFAATNSRQSINKQLVAHALDVIGEINAIAPRHDGPVDVELIDLNDYEMPIYSIDRENDDGVPQLAQDFYQKIGEADALIISYAEHNGSYTAAYKNIFDWASRVDSKVFQNKPTILMSASPGKRGGASVLEAAKTSAPFYGAGVLASFSVGSFHAVFDKNTKRLTDKDLKKTLWDAMTLVHQNP